MAASPAQAKDRAQEVIDCQKRSGDWMDQNFGEQFEQVWKSYHCERDPEIDPNAVTPRGAGIVDHRGRPVSSTIDYSRTSIGMPDTWALIRRTVARVTAQIPNLKFRAKDDELGNRISRRLMYQWDRGGVQRIQKKHVAQAALFGWSVRPWWWESNVYQRTKRVNPLDPNLAPEMQQSILDQYGPQIEELRMGNPEIDEPGMLAGLLAGNARGGMLPVSYEYKGYVGPKTEFLFIGDCYPEPNFPSLQGSNWFIVERRRKREWLESLATAEPGLAPAIQELLTDRPNGSPKGYSSGSTSGKLRNKLLGAIDRASGLKDSEPKAYDAEWVIVEKHRPGKNPTISYVCEGVWLGEIPYPNQLDGKIAFTELVLIDDLLSGIGNSHARICRGLQLLHDRQTNVGVDLAYNVSRPLMWTTNNTFWDNPELIERHGGFRLVKVDHPNDLGIIGEQSAMAAVATNIQDEGRVARLFQMATGENNMSMQANVDPMQARTATGVRALTHNQDILSRDLIEMFNESGLKPDAEMMYMLNRSEMPAGVEEFDAAKYHRSYDGGAPVPKQDFVKVGPDDFQEDGEIEAEIGSTLADDDEARLQRAQSLFGMFGQRPDINQNKLVDVVLIALGEGRKLQEWHAQPPPPPPPEFKASASVSVKLELQPPEVQQAIIEKILGGQIPVQADIGGMPPAPNQEAPPPEAMPGASSFEAATGASMNGN